MDDGRHLRLAPIDRLNWREALAVQVTADQVRFVAGYQPVALVILAKAYIRPGDLDWEPLAICSRDSVVGVVGLAHSPTNSEMVHLAIDAGVQRGGVGLHAVNLVVAHVSTTRPRCQELWLTVHPDNEPAQRLYRRAGFQPTGQIRDGEPIWQLDFSEDRTRLPQ